MRPRMAAPPRLGRPPSFLDEVVAGADSDVVVGTGPPVEVGFQDIWLDPPATVPFSWKIPGSALGVYTLVDAVEEVVVLDATVVVEVVDLMLVVLVEVVDVGVDLVEDELGASAKPRFPTEEEPSVLKTTMFADWPEGTVTTQNAAPPAPFAESGLSNPPIPSVAGLIAQGKPLHPPWGHSILTPNVGFVPASADPVKMGFQPILTYVKPLASVFAPAT